MHGLSPGKTPPCRASDWGAQCLSCGVSAPVCKVWDGGLFFHLLIAGPEDSRVPRRLRKWYITSVHVHVLRDVYMGSNG